MHLELSHSDAQVFRCIDNNCSRSFSKFDSLKQHRRLKHSSFDDGIQNNFDGACSNALGNEFFNTENSRDESLPEISDDSNNTSFIKSSCFESEDSSFTDEEFEEQISHNAVGQPFYEINSESTQNSILMNTAKLYSYTYINKSRISGILKNTSTLLHNVLSAVQNDIIETCKLNGPDASRIQNIIKNHVQSAQQTNSEYLNLK